ncbi:DUF6088 family protein [Bradyrhizobium sp. CCGUVB14]|uniref:DUF6088 family protein n=1 Tax=Bradyrhizobium sp. CCGUVB14 TaxID=2949628 RepID=UPI0020B2113A|nr:DUF6088 family protein [Bradyrhizobium sp. CCGUVB14]MCP3441471.1 DUF6088 family protein [Bradyrhizobium sp. CCGUVB14]
MVSAVTRFGSRVFGAPVSCANHPGLTTQLPVRQVYLTSGPSRELRLGKHVALFEACARRVRPIGTTAPRPPSHVVKRRKRLPRVAALRLWSAPIPAHLRPVSAYPRPFVLERGNGGSSPN